MEANPFRSDGLILKNGSKFTRCRKNEKDNKIKGFWKQFEKYFS